MPRHARARTVRLQPRRVTRASSLGSHQVSVGSLLQEFFLGLFLAFLPRFFPYAGPLGRGDNNSGLREHTDVVVSVISDGNAGSHPGNVRRVSAGVNPAPETETLVSAPFEIGRSSTSVWLLASQRRTRRVLLLVAFVDRFGSRVAVTRALMRCPMSARVSW